MIGRERFLATLRYGVPDRVPLFDEGLRDGVRVAWSAQGLPPDADLGQRFVFDQREEIEPDLEPRPRLQEGRTRPPTMSDLRRRLDPDDPARLPGDWPARVEAWKTREQVLMLRVHRGFFQSMGVEDSASFTTLMYLLNDDPGFVRASMRVHGEFAAGLAERVLREVTVDAAVFSEPIAGNHGPLISPRMYEEFVLRSYAPILEVLDRHGVDVVVLRTYANPRVLIPSAVRWGFNCLWASEASMPDMDYRGLRGEFGRALGLIGGIDLEALRSGEAAIRREIEQKVPALLASGGYIPLAGGRVREDISYANYACYRRLLEDVTGR